MSETAMFHRDLAAKRLAKDAVDFVEGRIWGFKDIGYRGMTDLENAIYGWLFEHAIFDEEME